MAKRFTDTEKYKKPFVRGLQGAYKLLWDYLYHDCDHAGIWIVDFEIAQIYLGSDMPVNEKDALKFFNKDEERVIPFDNGNKWIIKPFIEFQYGELNPDNRVHKSVLKSIKKAEISNESIKGLISPLQGCKDKDKDKDKDKVKDKEGGKSKKDLEEKAKHIYQVYPRLVGKKAAIDKITKVLKEDLIDARDLYRTVVRYAKAVEGKDKEFIPYPATWFNQHRFLDDPSEWEEWKGGAETVTYDEMFKLISNGDYRQADFEKVPSPKAESGFMWKYEP